jgi:hypothetical protein
MARGVADRLAAGFGDDRGFAERHAQSGVAVEQDHVQKEHQFSASTCGSPA